MRPACEWLHRPASAGVGSSAGTTAAAGSGVPTSRGLDDAAGCKAGEGPVCLPQRHRRACHYPLPTAELEARCVQRRRLDHAARNAGAGRARAGRRTPAGLNSAEPAGEALGPLERLRALGGLLWRALGGRLFHAERLRRTARVRADGTCTGPITSVVSCAGAPTWTRWLLSPGKQGLAPSCRAARCASRQQLLQDKAGAILLGEAPVGAGARPQVARLLALRQPTAGGARCASAPSEVAAPSSGAGARLCWHERCDSLAHARDQPAGRWPPRNGITLAGVPLHRGQLARSHACVAAVRVAGPRVTTIQPRLRRWCRTKPRYGPVTRASPCCSAAGGSQRMCCRTERPSEMFAARLGASAQAPRAAA